MQIIRHLPDVTDRPRAVAIGNFDGLHLGHAAVIAAMGGAALAQGLTPSILTFEPHPRRFFTPSAGAFRLLRLRDKWRGLETMGVEQILVPRFDAKFAEMPAEAFLDHVLGVQLGAKVVVTGENFAFGYKRRGDSTMLKSWGLAHGVTVIIVSPVKVNGMICSSSAIRTLLAKGNMPQAATLLGHPYTLRGRVVHGDARGRTIGFPTANIVLPADLLLPAKGVYAVRIRVDGQEYEGVANLGLRPTVAVDKQISFEVYLFDTLQDLYGKMLEVRLVYNLRSEMMFDGLDALKAQIAKDCAQARHILQRPHE